MKLNYLQKVLVNGGFTAGETSAITGEPNMFTSGIDVIGAAGVDPWWSQIECHACSLDEAQQMRDFVLEAIDEKIARMTMDDFKRLS